MRLLILASLATVAFSQTPNVSKAQMHYESAASGLGPKIQSIVSAQSGPVWIGYTVPIAPGEHHMCGGSGSDVTPAVPVQLEASSQLVVLLRAEAHAIEKLRMFTGHCQLDAGGLPVYWLRDVRPGESVAYLETLLNTTHSAVSAIALHAGDPAEKALESLAAAGQPEKIRRDAIFWLGSARGRPGFEALSRIVKADPDEKIRKQAIFALTQSHEPQAIPTVIQVAHHDASPNVRAEALFWLAQRAGKAAIAELNGAIQNDPEIEVKKKAVFGLSQLPNHEGVPILIQLAKSNKSPAVRKQAIFWLGQSKDPRALAFFEEVLAR